MLAPHGMTLLEQYQAELELSNASSNEHDDLGKHHLDDTHLQRKE